MNQYNDVFNACFDNATFWPAIKWAQNVYMRVDESVKQIFVAGFGDNTLALPYEMPEGAEKIPDHR